jgi:predicted lipoprotein with Yx(FWY)xxD motif
MKFCFLSFKKLLFVFCSISILISLMACSSAPASPSVAQYTIKISINPGVGLVLVDSNGMTLYYFTKDVIGKSNAAGAILQSWPIFNAGSFIVDASLNPQDFATITRDDGQKQTTYQGWPLYYYSKDKVPGDVLGEGVAGMWFVLKVPFYTVMLQSKTDVGNYLVDSNGMSLYYFTRDSVGKSTATAALLANWPIFNVPNFVVVSAINTSDFSTIKRDDGQIQATYKGWPLYYYVKDQVSGDTNGQGVGGVWYLIDPTNFPPAVTGSPNSISGSTPAAAP